jgi:hypothetical protein
MSRPFHQDSALDAAAVDEVVHAIEAAQQGGLATTTGPDEGDHVSIGDLDVHVVQRLLLTVEEVCNESVR